MASQAPQVSVTAPIHPAIERVKGMLFRPFDLGKWFVLGFGAWLARMGQPGFGGRFPSGGSPFGDHSGGGSGQDDVAAALAHAKGWVGQNLYWLLPLAIVLVCLGLALWVLFTWLSSRGQFVFLHGVARDRAEIAVPWGQYAREAHSLFVFRLVLGLIALPVAILFLVLAAAAVLRTVQRGAFEPGDVVGLVLVGVAVLALSLVLFLVSKLTRDFVVPIMYLRGGTCRAGWRELLVLFAGRLDRLILYLLFQIVLAVAIGVVVLAAVLATCCLAGCLMLIPYLGTVALLPVLVFRRSYSLFYLGQLGERYDVFRSASAPPPVLSA